MQRTPRRKKEKGKRKEGACRSSSANRKREERERAPILSRLYGGCPERKGMKSDGGGRKEKTFSLTNSPTGEKGKKRAKEVSFSSNLSELEREGRFRRKEREKKGEKRGDAVSVHLLHESEARKKKKKRKEKDGKSFGMQRTNSEFLGRPLRGEKREKKGGPFHLDPLR